MQHFSSRRAPALVLVGLALMAIGSSSAWAQQVYRHVDKNGKVVFSDRPPAAEAHPAAPRGSGSVSSSDSGNAALPYELRQVAQRYPVTIYTRDDCGPCDAGRALLTTRGIPFDERQIKTAADGQALQRLSGQDSLPMLSIGAQQLKGFSDGEWSQYLDAAGYPKSIALPAAYRRPPAQPMVATVPSSPVTPAAASSNGTRPPAPTPPQGAAPAARGPTPQNPAGIQF
jgi:glutaredoxin